MLKELRKPTVAPQHRGRPRVPTEGGIQSFCSTHKPWGTEKVGLASRKKNTQASWHSGQASELKQMLHQTPQHRRQAWEDKTEVHSLWHRGVLSELGQVHAKYSNTQRKNSGGSGEPHIGLCNAEGMVVVPRKDPRSLHLASLSLGKGLRNRKHQQEFPETSRESARNLHWQQWEYAEGRFKRSCRNMHTTLIKARRSCQKLISNP